MKAAIWLGEDDVEFATDWGRPPVDINGDGKFRCGVTEIKLPAPGKGEAIVEVQGCGVCGSDIYKAITGSKRPGAVLGHEVVGRIVAIGQGVHRFRVGDRVLAWHHAPCGQCHYCRRGSFSMCRQFRSTNFYPGGFAQQILLSEELVDLSLHKLPPDTSLEVATFIEPLACIYRALDKANLRKRDTALIIGAGFIGQLALTVLKDMVEHVVVTDVRAERLDLAVRRGATDAVLPSELNDAKVKLSHDLGADFVFMTYISDNTIKDSLSTVRDGGVICQFAGPFADVSPTWASETIYNRDLTIYGSYSPSPSSFSTAFRKVTWGDLDLSDIETGVYPLNQTGVAISDQANLRVMKSIVMPNDDNQIVEKSE